MPESQGVKIGMHKLAVLRSDWTAKILQRSTNRDQLDTRPSRFALVGVATPDYTRPGLTGTAVARAERSNVATSTVVFSLVPHASRQLTSTRVQLLCGKTLESTRCVANYYIAI